MSAIHEAVSWSLSQVSVTARISIVFEIIISGSFLTNGTNVSGGANVGPDHSPRFRLTSPASSRINANLNVGVERGIGSNFRLK